MNPDLLFRSRSEEIKGWKENNVFDEISYNELEPGTKKLSVRWLDSWKQGAMGTLSLKSRCVIKGNQEDTSSLTTYAPTVSKEMTMFITSLAAINR